MLHTVDVWFLVTAAGEIWNWSLSRSRKGLKCNLYQRFECRRIVQESPMNCKIHTNSGLSFLFFTIPALLGSPTEKISHIYGQVSNLSSLFNTLIHPRIFKKSLYGHTKRSWVSKCWLCLVQIRKKNLDTVGWKLPSLGTLMTIFLCIFCMYCIRFVPSDAVLSSCGAPARVRHEWRHTTRSGSASGPGNEADDKKPENGNRPQLFQNGGCCQWCCEYVSGSTAADGRTYQ